MNTTFTLKNVEFTIAGESFKIGELSTTVSDYNVLEGLQVLKELPAIARQLKDIIVEGIQESEEIDFSEADSFFQSFDDAFENGYSKRAEKEQAPDLELVKEQVEANHPHTQAQNVLAEAQWTKAEPTIPSDEKVTVVQFGAPSRF